MLYVVGVSCARGPDLIGIVGIMQGDPQTERYLYHLILPLHTRTIAFSPSTTTNKTCVSSRRGLTATAIIDLSVSVCSSSLEYSRELASLEYSREGGAGGQD